MFSESLSVDTVILKLGGSLITQKEKDTPRVRGKVLERLASEVARALSEVSLRLVVVHGAGPFGHVPAGKHDLARGWRSPSQSSGIAETRAAMAELNSLVVRALRAAGADAVGFQPSAAGILDGGRLCFFNVEGVRRFLDMRLVPVLFGDVLPDRDRGCAILSGDQVVSYLARSLEADRVLVATYFNGIFEGDPRNPASAKIDVVTRETLPLLEGRRASGTDVTGGIKAKVEELLSLSELGLHVEILSGLEPGYVEGALRGRKGIGTIVGTGIS